MYKEMDQTWFDQEYKAMFFPGTWGTCLDPNNMKPKSHY